MNTKLLGLTIVLVAGSGCSIQRFPVNSKIKAFVRGFSVTVIGIEPRCIDMDFRKDYDLHILGSNVHANDTEHMVKEMNAHSYLIETKSNLWIKLLT